MIGQGRNEAGQQSDSAGQTWGGRTLSGTGFDDDQGGADPELQAAIASGDEVRLMTAVAAARLLVPVVAAPTEVDENDGLTVEKSTDMAVVTLTAPDGQRALPVFSSIEQLAAWDAAARPSPVTAARAAQAAVAERCDVMVLDVAGEHPIALRASMVWALAQQRPWSPPQDDADVVRAVEAAVAQDERIAAVACEPGDDVAPGVLRVALTLPPGLTSEQIQQVATGVAERLATDGEVRARIDGLTFSIRSA